MNVFYTNRCPIQSARNLCKVHIVKMIVEQVQLLSTVHHILDGEKAPLGIYKPTHSNHPSAIWARKSSSNYHWLLSNTKSLCELYTSYSGKVHKSEEKLSLLSRPPNSITLNKPMTTPPAVVSDTVMKKFTFKPTDIKYQEYLKEKYLDWVTRTNKRPVKVEFVDNVIPAYMK